jgi:hypothetical protein
MKLPYEHKKLRAPNDKKRRPLSFGSSTGLGKTKAMALSCRKVRAQGRNHAMVIRRKERVMALEL